MNTYVRCPLNAPLVYMPQPHAHPANDKCFLPIAEFGRSDSFVEQSLSADQSELSPVRNFQGRTVAHQLSTLASQAKLNIRPNQIRCGGRSLPDRRCS